ncbi:MAG: undecaprenyl/decaprenyl-phosphate alpha-N-acetylglucosaminyl 1-phosphate transferase [Candidatus Omnitrophica bacterium]|nr:undecaprenyl/decaprenyl-phosphate alpha-N-acetylglucosaminyl 1-phosphate transferase [Candidatus Omnitrophota bacterium]
MLRIKNIAEVFILTTVISYIITPVIKNIAVKLNYLDHPKTNKVHARPTALLGGVSIYVSFIIGILMTIGLTLDAKLLSVIVGCTFLLVVGLVDDRMGMMPEVKLLGQFLAAMIVIKSGVRVEFLHNYYLDTIFTYLWIVGITNAFNLLDNMNGLSVGIAVIASIFFGITMCTSGQLPVAVMSFALAGAGLGFLKHNFPKASIFMGDTGSLVLGFVLASLAVMGSWSSKFLTTSLAMPILILAYPIFDTMLVTVMRLVEGRSIFQGGRDHSSHRLALLGFRKRRAVLVIYGICIVLGLSALLMQILPLRPALILIGGVAMFMLVLGIRLALVDTGRFGRSKKGDDLE